MFQEIHQHGIGKGMDAQESLLQLQDGTGRDRSGIPDLRRVADRNEKEIHHLTARAGQGHICLRVLHRSGVLRCRHSEW